MTTSPIRRTTNDALAEQLAELRQVVTQQQEMLAAQQKHLVSQEQRLAAQEEELTRLHAERAETFPAAPLVVPEARHLPPAEERAEERAEHGAAVPAMGRGRPASRRTLLKLGGAAAAAGVVAVATELTTPPPTVQASGIAWHTGVVNSDNQTFVEPANGSFPDPTLLTVRVGIAAPYAGLSSAPNQAAIAAYETTGQFAYGVYATSYVGTALAGISGSGAGVYASSSSGIDIEAGGTGRFWQTSWGGVGAPTTGVHFRGEQVRDTNGDLYICIAFGTPGTWRKVAAGIPGSSGALTFLATPIRLLDTRSGVGAPAASWGAGSTHTLQVTGVAIGGISVPGGALGVVGNLTVIAPSAGGDLRVYPGPTAPGTSSINFSAGQPVANGVTAKLSGSGQLMIKVDMPTGAHTHVLFDASGFIL